MTKLLRWISGIALLSASINGPVDRGSLTGTVRDPSGLFFPTAQVAFHVSDSLIGVQHSNSYDDSSLRMPLGNEVT